MRNPAVSALPLTILVIDDSPTVRRILSVYLAPLHATVLQAKGAAEAMEVLNSRSVDVVIADIKMPEVDGLMLVKALRSHVNPRLRRLPVALLTGEDVSRDRGLEAGANAFLHKPVSPSALFRVVGSLVGRQPASAVG